MSSAGTTDFSISEIGQIAVIVHDLERAVLFYRDVLGLQFLFEAPGMAFFQCGGVRLMLGLPEKPEYDHPASIIYYRVGDIDSAYETLREAAPASSVNRGLPTKVKVTSSGSPSSATRMRICLR